jgi:hypothetical protein
MPFPIKTCVVCGEEFELKPDKPGYANRCLECSSPESETASGADLTGVLDAKSKREANEARREAMRNMLYRKDS